jgi:hypothetical protein
MPITKDDIRLLLNDPALFQISFRVGDIVVNQREFANLADYFEDDDIAVAPGTTPNMSFYHRDTHTLETEPGKSAPLALEVNALLLHECVHANVHVRQWRVENFTDEVAAYIAQVTFMEIKNPGSHVPAIKVPQSAPFAFFVASVFDVVDQYKLTTPTGLGARINEFDIFTLSRRLHAVAQYADIPLESMEPASPNVPIKGSGIKQLRMALRLGRRPR